MFENAAAHTDRARLTATLLVALAGIWAAMAIAVPPPARAAGAFAATDKATSVHHTSAVLNGHLDPGEAAATDDCHFELGLDESYGTDVPCEGGATFAEPEDVSAVAGSLTPGTTYHFRLRIHTSAGPEVGVDRTFTTQQWSSGRPTDDTIAALDLPGSPAGLTATAFQQSNDRLYLTNGYSLSSGSATPLYGLDTTVPGFPVVPPFGPLSAPNSGNSPGVAVDNSAGPTEGRVYLALPGDNSGSAPGANSVHAYLPSGAPVGGNFPLSLPGGESPASVAVDTAGNLWVGKRLNNPPRVYQFSPDGELIKSVTLSVAAGSGIAFDAADDLYVGGNLIGGSGDVQAGVVRLPAPGYDPAAAEVVYSASSMQVSGISFNRSSGHILIPIYDFTAGGKNRILELDPDGDLIRDFGENIPGATYRSVSVDEAHDRVYVINAQAKEVRAYGPPAIITPPTVTPRRAGAISDTGARLRGFVDPEGLDVDECEFEYGMNDRFDQTAPCESLPGEGFGDVPVKADVSGLSPSKTYQFRLHASNSSDVTYGDPQAFTTTATPPAIKGLETLGATARTNTAARLRGVLDPNGTEVTDCHFDWGPTLAYGEQASCDPDPGSGSGEVAVRARIEGLEPGIRYHFRLQATNANGTTTGEDVSFLTRGPPTVETTGAPVRTAHTADLTGRINARGEDATVHFEYGADGPCSSNPCATSPVRDAGSGSAVRLVSERVSGLEAGTTYYFRIVGENGNPDGPGYGADRSFTTLAGDDPLEHGDFPGAPESDRAWEMVVPPYNNGNPAAGASAIADDGNSVYYGVFGGTDESQTGGIYTQFLATRSESGWDSSDPFPSREDAPGGGWNVPRGKSDLSQLVFENLGRRYGVWRLSPDRDPERVLAVGQDSSPVQFMTASDDASRILMTLKGDFDSLHPEAADTANLYDITTGQPRLASVLPGGSAPDCGVDAGTNASTFPPLGERSRPRHWVSEDGAWVVFPSLGNSCSSSNSLYLRDLDAGVTTAINPAPLSGRDCDASFIRSTSEAVFFVSGARLTSGDAARSDCDQGVDIYRYEVATGDLDCVTCVVPGVDASVQQNIYSAPSTRIAVAPDGSRVYFTAQNKLLEGAPDAASVYRLNVETGELAFVARTGSVAGDTGANSISEDGSVFTFRSSDPSLNPIGGPTNGGTAQYYRYDDDDRSLTCVSCPSDGSPPRGDVPGTLARGNNQGPNTWALSADGDVFAFVAPSALVEPDTNTAAPGTPAFRGNDVYEWRDGRTLLVSDGEGSWPSEDVDPAMVGMSRSGDSIFFSEAARLTPDALDAFPRLYVARIGGGLEYPDDVDEGCSGDACQPDPEDPPPASDPGSESGKPGNPIDCSPLEVRLAALRQATRSTTARLRRTTRRLKRADHRRAKQRLRKRRATLAARKKQLRVRTAKTRRKLADCREDAS